MWPLDGTADEKFGATGGLRPHIDKCWLNSDNHGESVQNVSGPSSSTCSVTKQAMPQIRFTLDPSKLRNPDLDIRYRLPDSLSALPNSTMTDDGYGYSDDASPLLLIYLNSDSLDADLQRSLDFLAANELLDNAILDAATVSISENGTDWRQVYPPK
jgi:hypothetical protein